MKIRRLQVLLDGEHWADIEFGQTISRVVDPGPHVLKVTNSVYSKQIEFTAGPTGAVRFIAGNIMGGLTSMMMSTLGFVHYRVFLEKR